MKALVFLRTAITVVVLGLMMLGALWMCAHFKLGPEYFTGAKDGCVALAAIATIKSGVEHLANGSGVAGVFKTLFTAAKPAEPAP